MPQRRDFIRVPYPGHCDITKAAKVGAHHILMHMFLGRSKEGGIPGTKFSPDTHAIRAVNGKIIDENSPSPIEVKRVYLIGSNHRLFSDPYLPESSNLTSISLRSYGDTIEAVNPLPSELVSFSTTLMAKKIFDQNNVPASLVYMPTDLLPGAPRNLAKIINKLKETGMLNYEAFTQGDTPDIKLLREALKNLKRPHAKMQALLEKYGFGEMPKYNIRELNESEHYRAELELGNAMMYCLESQFRQRARKLVGELVRPDLENFDGIRETVKVHYPGGVDAWEAVNDEHGDQWKIIRPNGEPTYCIEFWRPGTVPVRFPISGVDEREGVTLPGPAKCAMMATALMIKMEKNYGFTHMIAATHSLEMPVASAGFFIARRIFGLKTQVYALAVNQESWLPESSALNGKHAFLGALAEPLIGDD